MSNEITTMTSADIELSDEALDAVAGGANNIFDNYVDTTNGSSSVLGDNNQVAVLNNGYQYDYRPSYNKSQY